MSSDEIKLALINKKTKQIRYIFKSDLVRSYIIKIERNLLLENNLLITDSYDLALQKNSK